jgi:signal transduction histidine kinase
MDTGQPETMRREIEYRDGVRRTFDVRVETVPAGICIISLDITDELQTLERLRSVESQLAQAQKMEAIGRLAGGIAHDFNNQLTVILGFTQMLLEQHAGVQPQRELQEIEAAAQRSAALIRQLLAFGKRQVLHVAPVSLSDVVRSVTRLLDRLLGDNVVCELRIDPDIELILADASQLEHVITNLAVNARDAMPTGGRLTITTGTTEFSEDDARQHAAMKSGRYAVLTVTDTGHGMDQQTQLRIFEPFFTTKEAGKGTGLGLAMVYGIVKQMNGFIWVYSEVGRGTTFRLYFPVTGARAESVAPVQPPATTVAEGLRTILVVEDDRGVREFVTRSLSQHGYEVTAIESAEQAWGYLRDPHRTFDLLIVDVGLPGQSGPAFVQEIEQRSVPVVFMSGYSELHIKDYRSSPAHPLLEKPFTSEQLLKIVRETLRMAVPPPPG